MYAVLIYFQSIVTALLLFYVVDKLLVKELTTPRTSFCAPCILIYSAVDGISGN